MAERPRSVLYDLAWGLLAVAVGIGLRLAFTAILGDRAPYLTFFPAAVFAGLFGGLRGGGLFMVLSTAYVWFAVTPEQRAGVPLAEQGVLLLVFLSFGGMIIAMTSVFRSALREVTRLRAQERILAAELQHRIKNTLAIVQSIAAQTLKSTGGGRAFQDTFNARLEALARAHARLGQETWNTVRLDRIVGDALEPFSSEGADRIQVAGPALEIGSDQALALTLCLHELATNACKHGALSGGSGAGSIAVEWRLMEGRDGLVQFIWTERDGPPVSPPTRRGFGARLLQSAMQPYCEGEVSLTHHPEGVVWSVRFLAD